MKLPIVTELGFTCTSYDGVPEIWLHRNSFVMMMHLHVFRGVWRMRTEGLKEEQLNAVITNERRKVYV